MCLCVYIWVAKHKIHNVYISKTLISQVYQKRLEPISLSYYTWHRAEYSSRKATGPLTINWNWVRFSYFSDKSTLACGHQVTYHLPDQCWYISMARQWQVSCDDFKATVCANMGKSRRNEQFPVANLLTVLKQSWWCLGIVLCDRIVRLA